MSAALFIAAVLGMMLVRAPHIRRSTKVKVAASRETWGDRALVALVSLGLLLPAAWLGGLLSFAETTASAPRLVAGGLCLLLGLYVLHRSHVDLGANWSNTLELREGHALVTRGIYARVRHPMYVALLLHGVGQAMVVPNWVAGPSFLVPFVVLVAVRLGAEEQMMREQFGAEYDAYAGATARLVPGVF